MNRRYMVGDGPAGVVHQHDDFHCKGTNCRPVVVLDPSDSIMSEFERLDPDAMRRYAKDVERCEAFTVADFIREVADQIEAQTKPLKPPEPTGLGAVVEDDNGEQWVRCHGTWRYLHYSREWDDIDAVRVLSEGVTQ